MFAGLDRRSCGVSGGSVEVVPCRGTGRFIIAYGFDVKVPINLSVWVQKGPANHSTTFAALRSYASDAGRTIITTGHCKENSTTRVFGPDVGAESSSVALDRSHKTHARQRRANCDSVEEEGHWSSSKSLDRTRGQQIKDELVIIVRPSTNILGAHLSCCVLDLWTMWHFVRMGCPANVRHVGHVSRTTTFCPACLRWCNIKEISLPHSVNQFYSRSVSFTIRWILWTVVWVSLDVFQSIIF